MDEERKKKGEGEKERERGEKEREERKRERGKNIIKCMETEKDERFNTFLQLSFYVLKIKSK
jgi:hypothetical protein